MEPVDKKRMLLRMCVGGLIALAALLPLGGVLCGALNRGGEPSSWRSILSLGQWWGLPPSPSPRRAENWPCAP